MLDEFNFYEYQIDDSHVVFAYKGPLTDVLLANFSNDIRKRLHLNTEKKVRKRIFAIFMELVQNVLYYSKEADSFDGGDKVGAIIILREENHFKVMTGNRITKDAIPKLLEKAEKINSLDRDALRDYKRQQRAAPQEEESKGAGIGLIHVALTSDNTIEVNIQELGEDSAFYMVGVNIDA